jgi:hypothetical protein
MRNNDAGNNVASNKVDCRERVHNNVDCYIGEQSRARAGRETGCTHTKTSTKHSRVSGASLLCLSSLTTAKHYHDNKNIFTFNSDILLFKINNKV